MEVDLKPASYGQHTVWLETKFSLQPKNSHWANVVYGSNLLQYHFKPGLWQCIKIATKHIWTMCFSVYTYIVNIILFWLSCYFSIQENNFLPCFCHIECKPVVITLTFRKLASYIQDGCKITLQMPHFIFIQQISVLNILNMLYNLHFFSLQNAIYFIMLPCLVSVLLTF